MGNDAHPWRDIPSTKDWGLIRGTYKQEPSGPAAGLLKQIDQKVQDYHSISKTDRDSYKTRAKALAEVRDLAKRYVAERGTDIVGKTGRKTDAKGGPIDPWVASLARRAEKKLGYLETLNDWVDGAKSKYCVQSELIRFLHEVNQSNERDGGNLLRTTPYAAMEKADPVHRKILFFVNDTGTGVKPFRNNPMGAALATYISAPDVKVSFYEWLEDHMICTGTPGVTDSYDDAYKEMVQKINYKPIDLHPLEIKSGSINADPEKSGKPKPVNTAVDFKKSSKGPDGCAAFVWDRDGHLWLHQHGDGFNHTSFVKGAKVKCSGMMVVKDGKVTRITDESGHYAPNMPQVENLVEFLGKEGCLADKATFYSEVDKKEYEITT